jgi:hypothetical protein
MTKKICEYFMAYEATKVFAIRKMKTQFINKIRIFYAQTLQKQCHRKLFFIGLKTRAEGTRTFLNLESLKCHFLDFGEVLTEFLWSETAF